MSPSRLTIGSEVIEHVDCFIHLETLINRARLMLNEISTQIPKVHLTFINLRHTDIRILTKRGVYSAVVFCSTG